MIKFSTPRGEHLVNPAWVTDVQAVDGLRGWTVTINLRTGRYIEFIGESTENKDAMLDALSAGGE